MKTIHRYSRGFPRLINTICENSLITGYAQQLSVITAEVVSGVANDFHLTTNGSKIAQITPNNVDHDLERAKNYFLDLYAATQKTNGSNSELKPPRAVKAGGHESDI